jgi:hypothetical protein
MLRTFPLTLQWRRQNETKNFVESITQIVGVTATGRISMSKKCAKNSIGTADLLRNMLHELLSHAGMRTLYRLADR